MTAETIRDALGRTVARIEIRSNGDKIIRDALGRTLGRYDKASNVTRDALGRTIARGECLGLLIGR